MSDADRSDEQPGQAESFGHTESLIRQARNYVRPSEQLRPRTLEAARVGCHDRRVEQRLGGIVFALLILMVIAAPAASYVHAVRGMNASPNAAEMQSRAIEYGARPDVGSHWGFTEAFSQLRRVQSHQFGAFHRN